MKCGVFLTAALAASALRAEIEVSNPDFERGNGTDVVGWTTTSKNFAIVAGAGMNGNRGLVWHRAEKGGSESVSQDLTGWQIGERYTVTAKARTENFTSANWWGANAGLVVLDRDGKWLDEVYTHVHGANTPYTKKSATTKPLPENAARLVLRLMVGGSGHTCVSGTAAWDEIAVTRVEVKPVGFMRSSVYRNEAKEGKVRFGVALEVPYAHKGKVSGVFAWRDAADEVRKAPAETVTDSEAIVHLDVGRFAFGVTKVGFRLYAADGKMLGQASLDFTRPRENAPRRVAIDEHERCLVDGRPFFPLGLYFRGGAPQADLAVYRHGPFNCLMPYGTMCSNDLDRVHAAGLKSFIAFQGILKASKNGIKYGYTTDEKVNDFYLNRVRSFKEHPAVLGWYLFDEPADAALPELARLYGLMSRADPDHPIWGVHHIIDEVRQRVPLCDVIGMDPYPVSTRYPLRQVAEFAEKTQAAQFGSGPMWNVVQVFDWGSVRRDLPETRFPTEREMKSMLWQNVAFGAKGLIGYSFFSMREGREFDANWRVTCAAFGEVASLTNVLLSVEKAPSVRSDEKDVAVRVWAKGCSVYVLACNLNEKQMKARVTVSDGRWRIAGTPVGTAGTMADERTLAFDLPPAGYSMTRLEPRGGVPAGYAKLWNDEVNVGIDERIEKFRKADASFDGLPADVGVEVEQLTHAFQFGSHIFNFDQLGRDDWNEQYRATFTNLWNAATVAFYWDKMEVKEGEIRYAAGPRDSAAFWNSVRDLSAKEKYEKYPEYRRPAPDAVLDFLDAHGISVHGHPMIYPVFTAPWVSQGVGKEGLAARYERRIRQLGKHYGSRVGQWDVVNETVDRKCSMAGPFHDKVVWNRPEVLVPDDYTFRCHKWAEEAFPPDVKFEINDSWRPIYVPFVQSLIDRGAKIDVVGIQMHIFRADQARMIAAGEPCIANNTDWTPEAQFRMLWALDTLKRPIHISEITIPAFDDTPAGEEAQARMIRDNYRLWFSWPSVYRITYWNLVDHTYHRENLASGLYASDMRKKKAYHVLDGLINREWKTRLKVRSSAAGRISFRGFRGRYRLSWKGDNGMMNSREVIVK